MKNYYEVLGVDVDATNEQIVKAYEKLKFMYSKGVVSADILYEGNETEVLDEIENAYLVLSNPESRQEYNSKHGIETKKFTRYSFDSPETIEDKIVEIPPFANLSETNYDNRVNKINKKRLNSKGKQAPDYKIIEENELKIKNETEYRGEFFKFVREYKNMPYSYVSSKLKISEQYIKYLENEEFESLPAKVYVKGFIKSYAKLLGLPVDIATIRYMSRYEERENLHI